MPDSFGAQLRQRREERQIALETVAEQTKIQLSLLEALERDDVSHWPAGIFRRAFIRAYALAIGLQPDVVVREFLERHPDPLEEVSTESVGETAGDVASPGAGPPTRFRHLVDSAIGALSRLWPGAAEGREAPAADPAPAKGVAAYMPVTRQPLANATVAPKDQVKAPVSSEPDLAAAARLCTELGRVDEMRHVAPLLAELARLVEAIGLIVWVWDPMTSELAPALTHGYSDEVLAQLPNVKRDARNATAAAFRSGQTSSVNGRDATSDALVVPLMTPSGCAGVLAIELPHGAARSESVRALTTIFAAQMARLVGVVRPAAAASGRRLA